MTMPMTRWTPHGGQSLDQQPPTPWPQVLTDQGQRRPCLKTTDVYPFPPSCPQAPELLTQIPIRLIGSVHKSKPASPQDGLGVLTLRCRDCRLLTFVFLDKTSTQVSGRARGLDDVVKPINWILLFNMPSTKASTEAVERSPHGLLTPLAARLPPVNHLSFSPHRPTRS
jgi:hypothetical protein